MTQQPYVGQTVHYTTRTCTDGDPRAECLPATITALGSDERVSLEARGLVVDVPHQEIVDKIEPGPSGRSGGTWHWMECV